MSLVALLRSMGVEWYEGIVMKPPLYGYDFLTGNLYALEGRGCAKRYRNGSETFVIVAVRALHWHQDVPSSSIEQCKSEWRQFQKVSAVIDAPSATGMGFDMLELADIDLLFRSDASWSDDLGAVHQSSCPSIA